ncbi:MAG: hypothetical protein ACPG5T_00710 [Endozoicomonas sp.]
MDKTYFGKETVTGDDRVNTAQFYQNKAWESYKAMIYLLSDQKIECMPPDQQMECMKRLKQDYNFHSNHLDKAVMEGLRALGFIPPGVESPARLCEMLSQKYYQYRSMVDQFTLKERKQCRSLLSTLAKRYALDGNIAYKSLLYDVGNDIFNKYGSKVSEAERTLSSDIVENRLESERFEVHRSDKCSDSSGDEGIDLDEPDCLDNSGVSDTGDGFDPRLNPVAAEFKPASPTASPTASLEEKNHRTFEEERRARPLEVIGRYLKPESCLNPPVPVFIPTAHAQASSAKSDQSVVPFVSVESKLSVGAPPFIPARLQVKSYEMDNEIMMLPEFAVEEERDQLSNVSADCLDMTENTAGSDAGNEETEVLSDIGSDSLETPENSESFDSDNEEYWTADEDGYETAEEESIAAVSSVLDATVSQEFIYDDSR